MDQQFVVAGRSDRVDARGGAVWTEQRELTGQIKDSSEAAAPGEKHGSEFKL